LICGGRRTNHKARPALLFAMPFLQLEVKL